MAIGPVYENNYKVYWCVAIDDINAPSETELSAPNATYLGRTLMKDGAALGVSQNRVTVAPIDTLFDAERGGSYSVAPTLTLYRDDQDESDSWDMVQAGTLGYLVIAPFGVPEDGDKCMVFPCEMGVKQPADSNANTAQSYTVNFMVHQEPALDAVVGGES